MADLPIEVIASILSHLPVTSLLQFRSTSKSWRSLIDSDHFKTLHLHKLKPVFILRDDSEFHAVDFPILSTTVNLNQPLKSYENGIKILGSCNGLLCIKNVADDIAIWNPSLRKHWVLPYLPTSCRPVRIPSSRIYGFGFGFGFDPLTGDYKLVKISYFIGVGSTFESEVYLFSCRTSAWETLPNMPFALSWFETIGVFIDHALHWVVVKGNHKPLITAFDLRFEVFNEVILPKLGEGFEIKVSRLGRCLSMVVNYQNTRIDIWVMKQYESKDSWFKLFTLVESPELNFLEVVKPLGYYNDKDGMKVMFKGDPNTLFWYNLKSKQVSHLTIPRVPNFADAMFWVESLVQPPFPSENYRKQLKEKQKQQRASGCKYNTSKRRCFRFC